jgi:hypothetical protein
MTSAAQRAHLERPTSTSAAFEQTKRSPLTRFGRSKRITSLRRIRDTDCCARATIPATISTQSLSPWFERAFAALPAAEGRGLTMRQTRELLAARFPSPDAPSNICKLAERQATTEPARHEPPAVPRAKQDEPRRAAPLPPPHESPPALAGQYAHAFPLRTNFPASEPHRAAVSPTLQNPVHGRRSPERKTRARPRPTAPRPSQRRLRSRCLASPRFADRRSPATSLRRWCTAEDSKTTEASAISNRSSSNGNALVLLSIRHAEAGTRITSVSCAEPTTSSPPNWNTAGLR